MNEFNHLLIHQLTRYPFDPLSFSPIIPFTSFPFTRSVSTKIDLDRFAFDFVFDF